MTTIDDRVNRLVRAEVRALKAYHVPSARGLIKLDAMENPYRWPDALTGAWLEVLRAVELNRYPDPVAHALRAKLHAAWKLPAGMDTILGNGSDELIQII